MSADLGRETARSGPTDLEADAEKRKAELDEARRATKAAEDLFLSRQGDEATKLAVYREAAALLREAYAAERRRLEAAVREAEEDLVALDAKLRDLQDRDGEAADAPPAAKVSPSGDVDVETAAAANGHAEHSGYENGWYETLLQRDQPAAGDDDEDAPPETD